MMVAAKQSYRERMKAARAAERAKRLAEQAEWHRRIELHVEVRRLTEQAVKDSNRARARSFRTSRFGRSLKRARTLVTPELIARARANAQVS